jgi:hypothetical protein
MNEILREIFGEPFSISWFLPFKKAGYQEKFKSIKYD